MRWVGRPPARQRRLTSLTAAVRLRGARHTCLQAQQEASLPEITLEMLPLSLDSRVRYVAGAVTLYAWWYGLASGVLPHGGDGLVGRWPEEGEVECE